MLGRSVGLDDDELAALADWRESELFDEVDRAVLRYVDSVRLENRVPDEVFEALQSHFSQAEIMKLCIATTFAGLVNGVHATFRTELDASTLESVRDAPFCLIHRPDA